MRKNYAGKTILLLLLVLAIAIGIVPVEALQASAVSAEQEQTVAFDDLSWTLEAAAALRDGGSVRGEGEWQYVLLEDAGYAVITGHTGTQAASLTVPDMLGGADVVALADGALGSHAALESVMLPGNVWAIGDGALPRGVTIRGYNASYAQTYASKKGYAFEREAEFDFRTGVVDLADVRVQNIVRVSQYEVKLRALEARRLSVGKHFFYVDPSNAYAVSFYTVSAMQDTGDGFVTVTCTTPDVDSVLRSYSGVNETMVLDPGSVELYNGASLNVSSSSRVTLGPYTPTTISFDSDDLKTPIELGGVKMKFDGSVTPMYKATYSGSWLGDYSLKVVETRKVKAHVGFSYHEEEKGVTSEKSQKAIETLRKRATTIAGKNNGFQKFKSHTIPLGGGVVFSYAGIVNADVSWGFHFDINGSIDFTYSATTVTTFTYNSGDGELKRSSETYDEKVDVQAETTVKVGFTITLNLRIVAEKIFSVSAKVGAEMEMNYVYSSDAPLEPLNMLDCMEIHVSFYVEIAYTLGVRSLSISNAEDPLRLVDIDLGTYHLHFLPNELALTDDGVITQGDERAFAQRVHHEDMCPYDLKKFKVVFPWTTGGPKTIFESAEKYLGGQLVLPKLSDEEGTLLYEAALSDNLGDYKEFPITIEGWENYERRMESLHTDLSLDAESEVETWPHKIGDGATLYVNAVPLYDATIMYSDGTRLTEKYAEGEYVDLSPFAEDDFVVYWARVKGETDLTVLEKIEKIKLDIYDGPKYLYKMPAEDAWFHAVCSNDIELEFYLGNGEIYTAFASGEVGAVIEAPTITPTLPRYAFTGWMDKDGNADVFPLTVTQEMIDAGKLVFEAMWEETGEITATDLEDCGIGTIPQRADGYFAVDANSADYLDYITLITGKAMITGLNSSAPEGLNLKIPAVLTVDGKEYTVTSIGASAFAGETKLRSVELPDTVTDVGVSAFSQCTNLELLHMSACSSLTSLPNTMASGCTKLECVLVPKSVESIGIACFQLCTAIKEARINARIGDNAFQACSALESVALGAGVTEIGSFAFMDCKKLGQFAVPDSALVVGEDFIKGCTAIKVLEFVGRPWSVTADHLNIGEGSLLESVTFGVGVRSIGADALSNGGLGFAHLKDVYISSTVTSIGSGALKDSTVQNLEIHANRNLSIDPNTFANCKQLKTLQIYSGAIGVQAFNGCDALQSVYIGPLVDSIGKAAFMGCAALTDLVIEEGVETIAEDAFNGCAGLSTLRIPKSVTSYGSNMIKGCTALTHLYIGGGVKTLSLSSSGNPFYIGEENSLSHLEIGEGVIGIGAYVFSNANTTKTGVGFASLKTVKLPQTLTAIGSYAFAGAGIEEIETPQYLQTVASGAFSGCSELVKAKINSVKRQGSTYAARASSGLSLGSNIFANCENLEEIVIAEGVTSIEDYAFKGLTSLKRIEFPDSVTSYGNKILEGCVNLEELVIGGGVSALMTGKSSNGNLYYTPFYIGNGSKLKRLVIREGVTSIGDYVFANSSQAAQIGRYTFAALESISLPSTLQSIGAYAFEGTAVTEISIPENMTSLGSYAFADSASLKTLTVKGTNLAIGSYAFSGASALETAKLSGVSTIGSYAFSGAGALAEISLEEGLETIGDYAFRDASSLKKLVIPDSVTRHGHMMISGCKGLEELTIGGGCESLYVSKSDASSSYSYAPFYIGPSSALRRLIIGEGVKSIGERTFTNGSGPSESHSAYFPNLESVVLPQTLESIGEKAFYKSGLKTLEIPGGVGTIGNYAFAENTRLTKLKLGGTGLTLGSYAFSGNTALAEAEIEEGVASIGNYAFKGLTSLKRIEFPDSVTSYGNKILEGCVNLEELVIGGGDSTLTTVQYSTSNSFSYTPFYIGNGSKLKRLVIREGVTSIGDYVFANASSIVSSGRYTFAALESISLPSTLQSIGAYAFEGTAVTEISIPENMTGLGSYAFADSASLKTLIVQGTGLEIGSHAFSGAGALETVKLSGVSTIGSYAFSGAGALTEISLEEGLETIGNYAFRDASSLKKLVIPDSVTGHGHMMISGCKGLEELTIGGGCASLYVTEYSNSSSYSYAPFYIGPSSALRRLIINEGVKSIGERTFANGSGATESASAYFPNLESVVLPQTLESIGANAFYKSGLKTLEIPGGVGTIGSYAFAENTRLTKLKLGGTGLTLGSYAFSGNTALAEAEIEEGVTSIGDYAFKGLTSLKRIEFPDSVTSYGNKILEGCVNLEELVIGGGVSALMTGKSSNGNLYYTPFYIGNGSKLKRLVIHEGVTSIGDYVFANASSAASSGRYTFAALESVLLPESLTTIGNYNLSCWPAVTNLHLGANIASLTESGSAAHMTLYTDAFSEVVDAFAASKGCTYLVRDPETYPKFTVMRVSSVSGTVGALYVSDGTQLVTYGLEGETALLEAGYAVLSEEEVYYGDEIAEPEEDPQAEGYVFGGWYADPEFTMQWTGGAMPACDLTLYARMMPISDVLYAVDVADAGAADERLPEGFSLYAVEQLVEGATLLPPTPAAEGRIFDKWYLDAEGTQAFNLVFDLMPAQEMILYGRFVPQYEAAFVVNLPADTAYQSVEGEAGFSLYTTVLETEGVWFDAPPEPVTEGYVFTGWFEEPSFEHEWTGQTMPEGGTTVYGRMARLRAGGVYTLTEEGYQLKQYVLEQDESSEVYLPAKVNGVPVVSIGAYAFKEDQITKLQLPENLVSYDSEAFTGMSQLKAFTISANNPNFAAKDGVLYSKDMTTLYRYPRGKSNRSFTVPASVTTIAPRAFEDCSTLRAITLPDGLTSIGEYAFDGCTAISSMVLPDGVTAIAEGTFANCTSLLSLTAYGVTSVVEQSIPFNLDMNIRGPLGSGALRDYCVIQADGGEAMLISYNLRKVKLYIDGSLFKTALCEAGMKLPAAMESGQRDDGTWITGWFTDSALTTPWTFASDLMPDEDISLYTVSRPVYESVSQTFVVGTQTAEDGTVTELTQTGLLLTAYNGDGGVVMLPRSIGGEAVLGLGENFLASANGVVEAIDIGSGVVFIADTALVGPTQYPFGGIVRADAGSYAAQWALEKGYTVEGSVYTLTFETDGAQITAKTAGAGTVIKLPTPVKTGAVFAGWYLDSLWSEPAALNEDGLFIMPAADTTLYAAWEGEGEVYPFAYEEQNGCVVVTGYLGTDDELVIPEAVNGLPVTAVAEGAFEGDATLASVTLPASVTVIGSRAFAGSAVSSVDLGGAAEIGESAFARCTQLSKVTMANVQSIGEYAFRNCIVLRTLSLPDSLRQISAGAFMGCTGIGSVTLPDGVEAVQADAFSGCISLKQAHLGMAYYVDANAFSGCTSLHTYAVSEGNTAYSASDGVLMTADGTGLISYPRAKADTSFAIPDGVTDLADGAFAGAVKLTQITVPASLTWMGSEAFRGCAALTAFELPDDSSLTAIAQSAFVGCYALERVRLSASVTSIADNAFAGCLALVQVEIPLETTDISDSAFGANDQLLIIGATGSAAHAYAKEKGFLFSDPDAQQVEQLTISADTTVLQRGETAQLTLTGEPAEAVEAAVITWRSSDTDVVIVNEGVVHAIGGGFAEVYAQADNSVEGVITIEVQVAAQSVTIEEIPRFARGASVLAAANVMPESATNKVCTWESSDETVFTVDETGLLAGVGEGVAVLTATTHNGLTAQLEVEVFNAVETIVIEAQTEPLYAVEGLNSFQLAPTVLPEDVTDASLLFASADETLATVDEAGLITALMPGEVIITVTAADGGGAVTEYPLVITARDISSLTLPAQEAIIYDTLAHTPQFTLEMDGLTLVEGTDYTVTAAAQAEETQDGETAASALSEAQAAVEAVDAGVYPFTVTGIGKYCGSLSGELVIEKAVTALTYTGEAIHRIGSVMPDYTVTPSVPVIERYMRVNADGSLTELESLPAEGGSYRLSAVVEETNNYTAAEFTAEFMLVDDWFSMDYVTLALRSGQSVKLVSEQLPAELEPVPIVYASANTAVAYVDESGVITGAANGATTITATTQGGEGVTFTFEVTVADLERELSLPGLLRTVEAEAFEGCADVDVLTLGENMETVGSRAFAGMTALRQAHLPLSLREIADDAFDGAQDMVIFCEAGSSAQQYAERLGIAYVLK